MRSFHTGLGLAALPLLFSAAFSQETSKQLVPESPGGLDSYAQGGVVVDGIACFAASDRNKRKGIANAEDFPAVVAFDVRTFKKLKTYKFSYLYDGSPLVFQRQDGTWLVIGHEQKRARTVPINRDTGKLQWVSAANQPGALFFGYSFFQREDGSKLILTACANGLHAQSSQTGEDVWWVKRRSSGGVTPCVDQQNGWVFYQGNGQVLKLCAIDGRLEEVFDYGWAITSCATSIIARGRILSGDLYEDRIVVTKIAENSSLDWPGPFGDPQTNQMALPHEPGAKPVPMQEIGRNL